MKMERTMIKTIGLIATVTGAIATVVSGVVEDKELEFKIADIVKDELAKING